MKKDEYLDKRKGLLNQAQKAIDEGKLDDAAKITKQVQDLDAKFEAEGKAQANLNALSGTPKIVDISTAGKPVAGTTVASTAAPQGPVDVYDSDEYRKAFMDYTLRGKAFPANLRDAAESTTTPDVGAVIPTTIAQRIVEKMESIGMILPLVTHTAYRRDARIF
jgi:HK97 family phage major capsid protein